MNKQIVLRFTSKYQLVLDTSLLKIRKGFGAIFDVANLLNMALWLVFPILFFTSDVFFNGDGSGSLSYLYFFAGILLALQLIKKVLAKAEYLPQVPYDLLLLFFTTCMAISLFYSTVILKKGYNIWGGEELRSLSGISIIVYWFIYYLFVANFNSKKILAKFNLLFWGFAPIIGIIVSLFLYSSATAGLATLLVLLIPAYLWLVITQIRWQPLYLLNLILGVALIPSLQRQEILLVVILVFIVSAIAITFYSRKHLMQMLVNLDDTTDEFLKRKLKLRAYLNRNYKFLYLIVSALVLVIGIGWMFVYRGDNLFGFFVRALQSFNPFSDPVGFILGKGLISNSSVKLIQIFHIYGLLAAGTLFSVFVLIKIDLMKLVKTESGEIRGQLLFLNCALFAIGLAALISPLPDLAITVLPVLLGIAAVYKLQYLSKQDFQLGKQMYDLSFLKQENYQFLFRFAQICAVIIITITLIYFLNILRVVNIYLK